LALIAELMIGGESWLTGGVQGISSIPRPLSDTVGVDNYNLFYFAVVWALVGLVYLLFRRLQRSPFGRVLWSIREDEQVPKALGKHTTVFKLKSFGLGAAVAGLAGGLWAHFSRAITPGLLEPHLTFLILTAIIVGGTGSYLGAVIGTVGLMSLYQAVEYVQWSGPLGDKLPFIRMMIIGVVLILVMYYRPHGLLGDAERKTAGESGE
jgi:branched-chain amino acid transport system permease protein